MKTRSSIDVTTEVRSAFIETLNAEFTARTGVGAYVYLTPVAIDQLFNDYMQHKEPIRVFAKNYVKTVLAAQSVNRQA